MSEPAGRQSIAWGFVAVQFLLIALVVLMGGDDAWPVPDSLEALTWAAMATGVVVMIAAAAGLGRGLTAAPLPNTHARLRTGGLYRLVRHPIYSGLLLFVVAHTVRAASWLQVALCVALVVVIAVKARWEEARLSERFPGYAAYAARTPRFVPLVPPARRPATRD